MATLPTTLFSVSPWLGARGFSIGFYFMPNDWPLLVLTAWKWLIYFGKHYKPMDTDHD